LNSLGKDALTDIVSDFVDVLGTSAAVYENNGDYALGIFASGWCKFLDRISRELCGTSDNKKALESGKWLCHESCWTEASKVAVETRQPVDIECRGGIHLFAVPILAEGEVIGSMNFGYGTPPKKLQKLREIANKFGTNVDELLVRAKEYKPCSPDTIEICKKQLLSAAILVGLVVEHKQAEESLEKLQRELILRNEISDIFLAAPDDEMYRETLQVILKATESKYGIFGYIDEQETLVIPSMTRDIWSECQVPDKSTVYPRDKWRGIWGRALIEKRTLYANEGLRVPPGHIPIERVICVPIMYHGKRVGLLEAANRVTDYDEEDREFLETVANKIAPVLNARLERDRQNEKRREAEEKIQRLNLLLRSTRSVNQLITHEHDASKLLKESCNNFLETRSCYHAWSVLLDDALRIVGYAEAGLDEDFSSVISQAGMGHLPTCCNKALGQAEVVVTRDPRSTCADCTLSHRCANGIELAVSLKYGDKLYGFLCVSMPKEIQSDTEVFVLFREVADDISLALRNLELEAEHRKMDEIKDSLIGMVSHELRTPLTVVTAAVKTAIDERISQEERRELLQEAVFGAESLSAILDNLLELSRHQAGRLTLDKKRITVAEVVKKTLDRGSRQGLNLTHVITLDIPSELPPVLADTLRLEQILHNLIENAIKYSPEGSQIQVFARQESQVVIIGVTDHGIGIAPEDQKRLFEPFSRLEQTSKGKGIGLGLVVCKRLVEAHGGRIWVESKPGEGSTFLFTVPQQ
jgi:K+-sensing histidine kinase KdpD